MCEYIRMWTDVFHVRYPDAGETIRPAMSVKMNNTLHYNKIQQFKDK